MQLSSMNPFLEDVLTVVSMSIGFAVAMSIVIFTVNTTSPNCDLNHDNELTIKDLSILATQINNK